MFSLRLSVPKYFQQNSLTLVVKFRAGSLGATGSDAQAKLDMLNMHSKVVKNFFTVNTSESFRQLTEKFLSVQ